MAELPEIGRFALYGEVETQIAPEFVHIEPISERSRLHEWTISPHAHPGIVQLLLVEAGGGLLATEGREAPLDPPTLVALPSGSVHAFRFASQAEGWVLSLAVPVLSDARIAAVARGSVLAAGAGPQTARIDAAQGQRLSWLLADLAGALAAQWTSGRAGVLGDGVAARIALVVALSSELLAEAPPPAAHASRRARIAAGFAALVEAHFRDGLDVSGCAARLATTPQTLTRACRESFGKPPGEVMLDRVLLEAMRALTYTAASVRQIALDLGFEDPAYFARFFKARTGMTASHFRKERAWFRARG